MKKKIYNLISLISNGLIAVLVAYAISTFFTVGGEGNMEVVGFKCFKYFTVLSNVLVALSSIIYLIYNIIDFTKKTSYLPFIVLLFKYIGTVAVTVTFLTVVFFLGPTLGYIAMFEGVNLILHAIVPIIAIVSLSIFELNKRFEYKHSIYGLVPTILYSIIYIIMVVIIKGWEDFYGFTFGGKMYLVPVSIIMMYFATLLFSLGLIYLHNKIYKRNNFESK